MICYKSHVSPRVTGVNAKHVLEAVLNVAFARVRADRNDLCRNFTVVSHDCPFEAADVVAKQTICGV